ncbi:MAG: nuclear transport factor 2 family protein [Pseudomonadota bacterium]
MASTARLLSYACHFEDTYRDDNWDRLVPYFSQGATYEDAMGKASGRDAVIQYMRKSVNTVDRTFDERRLEPTGELRCGSDWVEFDFVVDYRRSDGNDLHLNGVHRAEFEGDLISRLEVRIV